MPNNLSDYEENRLLNLSVVTGDFVALLQTVGSDSAAGTEVSGGGYSRASAAFAAAASGSKASSAAHLFLNMPAQQVLGWGIFDAATAGNRKWYGLFNPRAATADATTDAITSVGHGLADDALVVFQNGFVPAGLSADVAYHVVGSTTDTFQVSGTTGGAAIDITSDSASVVVGDVIAPNAGEVFAVPSGALILSLS